MAGKILKIGIFWNVDDCPVPKGLDPSKVLENIKLSLANENYEHGEVSFKAYCDKKNPSFEYLSLAFDKLSPADTINFVPRGNQPTVIKTLFEDIYSWAVQNRVPRCGYPKTINTVVLISKIAQDMKIGRFLNALKCRGYIVLLAVPDALAYVSSVWLWPSLTHKVNSIDNESGSSLLEGVAHPHEAKTRLFWNMDDLPIPEGYDLLVVYNNIKSALANNEYRGDVSISAYSEKYGSLDGFVFYSSFCGMILKDKVLKEEFDELTCDSVEVDNMLVDILLWALDNPAPSNLLVISKNISEETDLLRLLQALESKGYNILVVHTKEALSALLHCTESLKLHLKSLESLYVVPDKGKKRKRHEACNTTTNVLWNIEDCPVPGGFEHHMFLELLKSSLASHGHDGKVSISAYCEKDRSLDEFSHTDIICIPIGNESARSKKMFIDILFCALEYRKASNVILITKNIPSNISSVLLALNERNVKVLIAYPCTRYAKSVWLWPSLACGGTCID